MMRIMTASVFKRFPKRCDFESALTAKGYTHNPAGGSGGSIFMHANRDLVWKIADDPATAEFADLLASGWTDPAAPRVFLASPKGMPYSVLAMEKLNPLTFGCNWYTWYMQDYVAMKGSPHTDPYGASAVLNFLRGEAHKRHVNLDVQPQNVMIRRGSPSQIVLFDPFY
ncbi:hypothetical protein S101468_02627 [Acetobacter pasteurianus subsp. pasteurianus]|uniref:Uncharacterized protein n=3 Tax=Acetobacteraceae TaxID=433 RepID=A0AAC9SU87_ACEPA|nr:hypothetical protein S101468_02627 [Acetobacter pasteurianus subsp. pasteurianus]